MMDDTLIRIILLRAFNCAQHRIYLSMEYGERVHFDNEPLNAAADDYKITHTLETHIPILILCSL